MRTLITSLQIKPLTRGEMAGVLQMGPSGVRKYLVDLAGKYEWAAGEGDDVCRLTISEAEVRIFLSSLAASARRDRSGRRGRNSASQPKIRRATSTSWQTTSTSRSGRCVGFRRNGRCLQLSSGVCRSRREYEASA
jgi:hypothetical protein